MSYKSSIDVYYQDLMNLLKMLDCYVINYKNLVSTLNDINLNVLISKRKKKKAIKQIEELGCIIDMLLEAIWESQKCYLNYIKMKCSVLCEIITCDFIRLEIEQEILDSLNDEVKGRFITLLPPKFKSLPKQKHMEKHDEKHQEKHHEKKK